MLFVNLDTMNNKSGGKNTTNKNRINITNNIDQCPIEN